MDWIADYLSDRRFCVRVGSALSTQHLVTSGVPQGSILGPLLFLIYVNELPKIVSSPCLLYADDIKLWRTIATTNDCQMLQDDLNNITSWLQRNKLELNPTKSSTLHINTLSRFTYTANGQSIPNATKEKDLGSLITSNLSLSPNTKKLISLAKSREGVLYRLLGKLDRESFPMLFRSYVRPYWELNIQAMSPYLARDTLAIERVQRRATRNVRGLQKLSYPQRLAALNLFPLEYRRLRGDLILVFKILRSPSHPLQELFQLAPTGQLRGHPLKLSCQYSRTNVRRFAFAVRVCAPWNSLPEQVVLLQTVELFKRALDHLMQKGAVPFNEITNNYSPQ